MAERKDKPHMNRPEVADLLLRAQGLVAEAIEMLDLSNHICVDCTRKTYHNYDEFRATVELVAAANKLGRWCAAFGGTAPKIADPTGSEEEKK